MHWDGTVSIGNVLTAAVLFLGFYHAHRQNISRLAKIEDRLNLIFDWWKLHAVRGFRNGIDE